MGRLLALLSVLYFSISKGGTFTGYCPSADQNLCISENLAPLHHEPGIEQKTLRFGGRGFTNCTTEASARERIKT